MGRPEANLAVSSVLRLPGHEVEQFFPGSMMTDKGQLPHKWKSRFKTRNDQERVRGQQEVAGFGRATMLSAFVL